MPQTISDSILELCQQIARGHDVREQLSPLLEQAIPAIEQQQQAFLEHAPLNPEFSPEMVSHFQAGLEGLREVFLQLRERLTQPPSSDWDPPCQKLQHSILTIRQAQAAHHELIEDGETSHLYINRLVIHLRAWQSGRSPGAMTQALFEGLAGFQSELQNFIDDFEDGELQERMGQHLADLIDVCQEVHDSLQTDPQPPAELSQWIEEIVDHCQKFDQSLTATVESNLSLGPTPFPILNLIHAASERYLVQQISAQDLANTIQQCQEWLQVQLPSNSDPGLLQAGKKLFKILHSMHESTLAQDHEQMLDQREAMIAAADTMALLAAAVQNDDEMLNLVAGDGLGAGTSSSHRPMPQLLAQILQQAQAYLNGQQGSEPLEESLQSLEKLVTTTQGQMARSRDSKEVKEKTQNALELLNEASEHLWDFVDSASPEQFQDIQEILYEVSDLVSSLSPVRR